MNFRSSLSGQTEKCFEKEACGLFNSFFGACIRALIHLIMEKLKGMRKSIFSCVGGLRCCSKPPCVTAEDEDKPKPSNGKIFEAEKVKKKPPRLEDSSSFEMDSNNTVNQTLDHNSTSGDFVNHGLILWNQTRQQWISNKGNKSRAIDQEPRISSDASYDDLLGTNEPFPEPIPLSEMVEFLVDVWEEEGLYD